MENAEESVRRAIAALNDCEFVGEMDDGHQIAVSIQVNLEERSAVIDFSGTSGQHPGNFNAPKGSADQPSCTYSDAWSTTPSHSTQAVSYH